MKTLSFVKQALAVALLISAGSIVAGDVPAPQTPANNAAKDKTAKTSFSTKFVNAVTNSPYSVRNLVQWPARKTVDYMAKLSVPYGRETVKSAQQEDVKQYKWANLGNGVNSLTAKLSNKYFVNQDGTEKGQYTKLGNFASHTGWFVAGSAMYAAVVYGAYKLYKKYLRPEVTEIEDNKEEAEPTTEEVVVVEETTAEPVKAVRSAQSKVFNPAR